MPISDATRAEAQRLVARYAVARSALLPLLHLVQSDEGFVSEEGITFCAELLALTKAEVGAVSTFYTMYKRERFGEYLLSVCTNPTCKNAGGQAILDSYVESCGGHVDHEAGVMVEHAECLAICDAAPVVQVNYEMYGPLTHDQAMELLESARSGQVPASGISGEVPPTFREVERELSGIDDGLDEQLIEAARLQAAAPVPPAYRSGETDIPVTHPGGDTRGHGGAIFRDQAGFAPPPRERTQIEVSERAGGGRDEAIVDDVAAQAVGVEEELADRAEGQEPGGPTPATVDEPAQQPAPDTPHEAADEVPPGTEADPQDSTAGEGGHLQDPDEASSSTDDGTPGAKES